jgi:hypothetical protein
MPEEHDLDRWIDEALGTYADPPQDGDFDANLAGRILTRIAQEPAPHPRLRWLPWAAVAFPAAIICLLLLIPSSPKSTTPRATPAAQSARFRTSADISVRPTLRTGLPSATARQAYRTAGLPHSLVATTEPQPLPKLDVFPTPTPLTSQERALATYVAHSPLAAQQALAQSEQEQSPLTVASVHVISLDALDEDANTN